MACGTLVELVWGRAHSPVQSSEARQSGESKELNYDARHIHRTQRLPQQAAQPADHDQHRLLATVAHDDDLHLALVLRGSGRARSLAPADYARPRLAGIFPAGILSRQDS